MYRAPGLYLIQHVFLDLSGESLHLWAQVVEQLQALVTVVIVGGPVTSGQLTTFFQMGKVIVTGRNLVAMQRTCRN